MAKKLNIMGVKSLPVANNGMKLSELISLEKIEKMDFFENLFSIDEKLLERIVEDMKVHGFDDSQPVHIWVQIDENGDTHYILIDGYTRYKAAGLAGLEVIPYFKHMFASLEEAKLYTFHLQADRRNLEGMDLLKVIQEMKGSEYIKSLGSNVNETIAQELGISSRTVKRANKVIANASDEQFDRIENGESTINEICNEITEFQTVENYATPEQKESIQNGESTIKETFQAIKNNKKKAKETCDELSKAENHFDDEVEFVPNEESFAKNQEIETAEKKAFAQGFYLAAVFVLGETLKGRTPLDIYNDKLISDMSPDIICNFKLPEDDEELVSQMALKQE